MPPARSRVALADQRTLDPVRLNCFLAESVLSALSGGPLSWARRKGIAVKNRAPRCTHGFYEQLCTQSDCVHFDGGMAEAIKRCPPTSRVSRGATVAARVALLASPQLSNVEIARACQCSTALVGMVRRELGLTRKRKASR